MMFLYDGKKLQQVAHTLHKHDTTAIGKLEIRASDSSDMVQRCGHQESAVFLKSVSFSRDCCVKTLLAMGLHHALRFTCSASGENNIAHQVDVWILNRCFCRELVFVLGGIYIVVC